MIKKELPTLYATSSNGKIKMWKGWVTEEKDGSVWMRRLHGYKDGKQQQDDTEIKSGKNIGRANATTKVQQAISDLQSKYNKKIDKKYTKNKSGTDKKSTIILPMLAERFKDRKHHIEWPALMQPKFDGVRSIYQNKDFATRTGKTNYYHVEHLKENLNELVKSGMKIPDGELYIHEVPLQSINRLCKKYRQGETESVEYWLFDLVDTSMPNCNRNDIIRKAFEKHCSPSFEVTPKLITHKFGNIIRVPSIVIHSEKEANQWHDHFVKYGFEGGIVRNYNAVYTVTHRTNDLQKLKNFIDEEFEIVGFKEATGRDAGTIVFRCITVDGKEFEVKPKGSRKVRAHWLEDFANIKGKYLTVRYQKLSNDGIPTIVSGLAIRDYE